MQADPRARWVSPPGARCGGQAAGRTGRPSDLGEAGQPLRFAQRCAAAQGTLGSAAGFGQAARSPCVAAKVSTSQQARRAWRNSPSSGEGLAALGPVPLRCAGDCIRAATSAAPGLAGREHGGTQRHRSRRSKSISCSRPREVAVPNSHRWPRALPGLGRPRRRVRLARPGRAASER